MGMDTIWVLRLDEATSDRCRSIGQVSDRSREVSTGREWRETGVERTVTVERRLVAQHFTPFGRRRGDSFGAEGEHGEHVNEWETKREPRGSRKTHR